MVSLNCEMTATGVDPNLKLVSHGLLQIVTTEDKQDPLSERMVAGRLTGYSWYLIPIMIWLGDLTSGTPHTVSLFGLAFSVTPS